MRLFSKLILLIPVVVLVNTLCLAQETARSDSTLSQINSGASNGHDIADDEKAIRQALLDSLRLIRSEIEQLQSVLERSTFGITSYYFTNLRSWLIPSAYSFNDTLAQYFFEVSENDSSFIQQRGDIQIIATTSDPVDLVAILFNGNEQEKKGLRLHQMLLKKPERNMYQRVVMSGKYGEERLLVDNNFRITNQLQPRLVKSRDALISDFTRINGRMDGGDSSWNISMNIPHKMRIQVSPFWAVEAKLGNEEVGYPSWLSGNVGLLASYRRFKFGIQFPFAGARNLGPIAGKVLEPRTMDGTYGALVEFDAGFVGGSLMYGARRKDTDGAFLNPDTIYTLRSLAQIWYSYAFSIGVERPTNLFRFKIGLGIHTIGHDRRNPELIVVQNGVPYRRPAAIEAIEPSRLFFSPYVKIDFVNQHYAHRFGASCQYYDEWGVFTAWLEIVEDHVRLELKGATPLLRERQLWEPNHFLMLSVPFTFSL